MEWTLPTYPVEPRDTPSLMVIEDATLSRFEQGPLRTHGRPDRYIRGAVYNSERKLEPTSQKYCIPGHPWVPADAGTLRGSKPRRRLSGDWLYGGHWIPHFGHFIIETITALWPQRGNVRGIVFHKYLRGPDPHHPWMDRLVELAGYGGLEIEVVDGRGSVAVDRLTLPSRSIVANGWGHPEAREVWQRVSDPFMRSEPASRVFLSRTNFNEQRRREGSNRARSTLERDGLLDRLFDRGGFLVVAPETLTIDEQVRLVANSRVLAGNSGSALHLSAFAPDGTKVLEIGDQRNPERPVAMQRVIDRLSYHPHHFVRGNWGEQQVTELLDEI